MNNISIVNYSRVLWITGLSGSGKSSIAIKVTSMLKEDGIPVVFLDGDELRNVFGTSAANIENHGREGRLSLAMQYSRLCKLISLQGLTVVIATISLFNEIHAWNRKNLPCYFEAYLKVPLYELRRRDPKGIYQKFDNGELHNVAGLDLDIDEPISADWVSNFNPDLDVSELANDLFDCFTKRKTL